MRVLFASQYDINEINSKSGVPYFAFRALQRAGCDVKVASPLATSPRVRSFLRFFLKLHNRLSGKTYLVDHSTVLARSYALGIEEALRKTPGIDFVFCPCTVPVAYLGGTVPVATYTDTTAAAIIDFYPEFSNLSWLTRRNLHTIEQRSLNRASVSIFTSSWARNSALKHYRVDDPSQLQVCSRGGGFFKSPSRQLVMRAIEERLSGPTQILWIGADWERKGGPATAELVRALVGRGIDAELLIIGASPFENSDKPDFVRQLGRLDKSNPDQYERFIQALRNCSFLATPSVAECLSIAAIEAFAYGVPCLAVDTGGLSDLVKNNETGFLHSTDDFIPRTIDAIEECRSDPDRYRRMAVNCFELYRDKLNWDSVGRFLLRAMEVRIKGNRR